jgi:hypothetical protein
MPDQYVPYSTAWFTLSLVNAGLAQSKGRSGLNWWLVSLFIGPLATLVIVAWPSSEPGADSVPPGRMTRSQAVVIAVVVVLVVAGIAALAAAGSR